MKEALYSVKQWLSDIEIFHTDRGLKFKNRAIDDIIEMFGIKRSLNKKGFHMMMLLPKLPMELLKQSSRSTKHFQALKS